LICAIGPTSQHIITTSIPSSSFIHDLALDWIRNQKVDVLLFLQPSISDKDNILNYYAEPVHSSSYMASHYGQLFKALLNISSFSV
jgi:hypothetical protein